MSSSALIRTGTDFDVVSSRYENQCMSMTSYHGHFKNLFGTACVATVTAKATGTTYSVTQIPSFSILEVEWNNNIQLV